MQVYSYFAYMQITTQEIPGKILDVRGDEDHFAVLSSVGGGESFNISILNAVGAPVDSKPTNFCKTKVCNFYKFCQV